MKTLLYEVAELPDTSAPSHRRTAGGDVRNAIRTSARHIVRAVANMLPSSVTGVFRFAFTPSPPDGHPQSRLRVFVAVQTRSAAMARAMQTLIEAGPLSKFFKFVRMSRTAPGARKFAAACRIYRKDAIVQPITDLNPDALRWFYTCAPFTPDESNDYMMLDRVLSGIDEEVIIDLAFCPTDVTPELMAHTQYLQQLEAINRSRSNRSEEQTIDLLEANETHVHDSSLIEPLREEDPIAKELFREQSGIQKTLRNPHVQFSFTVLAQSEEVARLIGSLVAESGFQDGTYQLHVTSGQKPITDYCKQVVQAGVAGHATDPYLLRNVVKAAIPGLERLPHIASVDELLGILTLPVPGLASPRCIRKDTDPPDVISTDFHIVGYDADGPVDSGSKRADSPCRGVRGIARGYPLSILSKHMVITGMSGHGKTTSIIRLLIRLHEEGIPFIVFETAKKEYRALCMLKNHPDPVIRDLATMIEIYTAGVETLSPLRFNPMQMWPGTSRNRQVGTLLDCIQSSVPMDPPLPALFREALEAMLGRARLGGPPPTMDQLVYAAESCLRAKKYSKDNESTARAVLDVRAGMVTSLAMRDILQSPASVPDVHHILTTPTILELDELSQEQKCLMTLWLLTAIREAIRTTPTSRKGLRLVVLIEEAHNVVGTRTDARPSDTAPDAKSFAAEYVVRMLAECRALGIAVVISDQSASAIAPQVIRSTATQLAFRQIAPDERRQIAAAMMFRGTDGDEHARLRTGEAFLFTEGQHGPARIRTVNLHSAVDLTPPGDEDLLKAVSATNWWRDAARTRVAAELPRFERLLDHFSSTCRALEKKAEALVADRIPAKQVQADTSRAASIRKGLLAVRAAIQATIRAFELGPLERYIPQEHVVCVLDSELVKRVGESNDRFVALRAAATATTKRIDDVLIAKESNVQTEVTS